MLRFLTSFEAGLAKIPTDLGLVLARFTLATIFWRSGQTKIDGLAIDLLAKKFELGWPRLADSTLFLFENEYALPIISPASAALLATIAEHLLPILLLVGFMTRFAALMLLFMTAVIQIFVYPDAWLTHGLWAALLLLLISLGAGRVSVDYWAGGSR